MTKVQSELKEVLKPLIKECIREMLLEEKLLSNVISEVVQGLSIPTLTEAVQPTKNTSESFVQSVSRSSRLDEQRKRLRDAIGTEAYAGVDIFENVTPAPADSKPGAAMNGIDSNDVGVDLSKLIGPLALKKMNILK
jgi:hypothetical protein